MNFHKRSESVCDLSPGHKILDFRKLIFLPKFSFSLLGIVAFYSEQLGCQQSVEHTELSTVLWLTQSLEEVMKKSLASTRYVFIALDKGSICHSVY